jgi:hypothetical protein
MIMELAAQHQVKPSTVQAWHERHRKNIQQPRRANLIRLRPVQIERFHDLRRVFRELLQHEKCAAARSTQQRKGRKSSWLELYLWKFFCRAFFVFVAERRGKLASYEVVRVGGQNEFAPRGTMESSGCFLASLCDKDFDANCAN